jgi:MFS family permease
MYNFLEKVGDQQIKKGLANAIWDGVLWAIMFGFSENYIVPFALVFGASTFQVSLIQGSAQLGVGLAQLLGSEFILRFRQRKRLAILCSRIHAFSWLFILGVTFWTKSPWYILVFYLLGIAAANFGGPGWISWMNDIVPVNLRGEFWGNRNRIIGLTQFVFIVIAGIVLQLAKDGGRELTAYAVLFSLAFVARGANFIPLSKQYEPSMSVPAFAQTFTFRIFLTKLFSTNFGRFVFFSICLSFACNPVGPLVPVYLLKVLHVNYIEFTIILMTSTIGSYVFMSYWGPLGDRFGNYRMLKVTALALPSLAFGWAVLDSFTALILLQLFSGFAWAGFNLATTNFIFDAVRRENISKITAYFNTLNTTSAFLGAVVGGVLVDILPLKTLAMFHLNAFTFVFLLSGVLRIIVIGALFCRFREVRTVEVSPALHFFYVTKPVMNLFEQAQAVSDWAFKLIRTRKPKKPDLPPSNNARGRCLPPAGA